MTKPKAIAAPALFQLLSCAVGVSILCATPAIAREPNARLTASEIDRLPSRNAGAGTSGISSITTTVLMGDPAQPGPYAIRLRIPPNLHIAPHTHRDDRAAVVVSGQWLFGYGREAGLSVTRMLGPGSFYTEPAGEPHFAISGPAGAEVIITGTGPSDTVQVLAPDLTRSATSEKESDDGHP